MTRIIQLTDTHIVCPSQKVSGVLDTYSLFERAIEKINKDLPKLGDIDGIIVTGDITDCGDVASYEAFKLVIERLAIPYYVIPGNHDLRSSMHQCFNQLNDLNQSDEINWLLPFHDIDLIGLDTVIPGSGGGHLSPNALQFLDSSLGQSTDKPALIAMHHPPFESGIQFMDAIGLEGVNELHEILVSTPREVRIICGHLHNSIVCSVGGKTVLSSPSTASTFLTDHRDNAPVGFTQNTGGYMLHEWNNGFRSSYLTLAEPGHFFPF
ncbi:phosphodiesterase [Enterovibrio nigricans]|uniref:Calcineurin-like phosphoesterase n=1 Tax=Enterovibrio nigricans DSM 22720 TaxID=1121868 RepID=A0A1T4UHP0_9GAMM|nr:phosphodiesterase [Enterovibrio nigricans]PKF49964.1 phosphodiesterase [Enterovibrio nigricans]SKA52265.1 Calcineurin-like phosphoesterase [Enterovibrio nigricans DSM 22720]